MQRSKALLALWWNSNHTFVSYTKVGHIFIMEKLFSIILTIPGLVILIAIIGAIIDKNNDK